MLLCNEGLQGYVWIRGAAPALETIPRARQHLQGVCVYVLLFFFFFWAEFLVEEFELP
jgi:hypothetical protein